MYALVVILSPVWMLIAVGGYAIYRLVRELGVWVRGYLAIKMMLVRFATWAFPTLELLSGAPWPSPWFWWLVFYETTRFAVRYVLKRRVTPGEHDYGLQATTLLP